MSEPSRDEALVIHRELPSTRAGSATSGPSGSVSVSHRGTSFLLLIAVDGPQDVDQLSGVREASPAELAPEDGAVLRGDLKRAGPGAALGVAKDFHVGEGLLDGSRTGPELGPVPSRVTVLDVDLGHVSCGEVATRRKEGVGGASRKEPSGAVAAWSNRRGPSTFPTGKKKMFGKLLF